MPYTTAEGRKRILDDLAVAVNQIAEALACLSAAYEQLDDRHADELEAQLFGPVQGAYGRARRTLAQFAARSGMPGRELADHSAPAPSRPVRALIERAVDAAREADQSIAALQDTMLPVEVGDAELRAGLSQVREMLAPVPARARELLRTIGR